MIFPPQIQAGDIYERNPDIRWQLVEGRAVLVDSSENELVHFNEIGTHVWEKLNGQNTIGVLLSDLSQEMDVDFDILKKDVVKFIRRLCQMELIRRPREGL